MVLVFFLDSEARDHGEGSEAKEHPMVLWAAISQHGTATCAWQTQACLNSDLATQDTEWT